MRIEELYNIFLSSDGVSIDTRSIQSGQLFFALKGRTFDGNQKAQEAIERGAAYSIVDDASVVENDKYILVTNVLSSLQKLANFHRKNINVPVLGITGSNGKTTTKELIREVLSTRNKVACTKGNYNNHIGLPLTLLNESKDADIWILEMGTNAPGNIQELCDIGNPTLGIITNIGLAHLEQLIDQEGVYKEKSTLFDSVSNANGVLFVNEEDPWLGYYKKVKNTIYYSSTQIDALKINVTTDQESCLKLEIHNVEEIIEIQSHLTGNYNIQNISAAIAVGQYFEIPLRVICNAISNYRPTNMRSELKETEKNILFIDAYNANPSSMRESVLSHLAKKKEDLVFILGDMLELGDSAIVYHESILELLKTEDVNVITVGPIFSSCANKIDQRFDTVESLLMSDLLNNLENRQILIKGSRGIYLEKVIPFL
ncbi:MAG: UDP-N-acetylmuramoyl-tripeptide--D-alanyl-D-alanine ligase [Saprospiraceae bacterium]|jgi:UDP-N-acetylmuramoyl-tripeptide--D-alanyl-D-alanine ligase